MTYDRFLDIAGNWAAILTAMVAVIAYGTYCWERFEKRRRLESHLRDEKGAGDQGQRTVLHLMAHLGMTQAEVLDAAFRSRRVRCLTAVDWQGRAEALLFEYRDGEGAAGRTGRRQF